MHQVATLPGVPQFLSEIVQDRIIDLPFKGSVRFQFSMTEEAIEKLKEHGVDTDKVANSMGIAVLVSALSQLVQFE